MSLHAGATLSKYKATASESAVRSRAGVLPAEFGGSAKVQVGEGFLNEVEVRLLPKITHGVFGFDRHVFHIVLVWLELLERQRALD